MNADGFPVVPVGGHSGHVEADYGDMGGKPADVTDDQSLSQSMSRVAAADGTDISFDPYFATREDANRNQSTTKYNRQPLTLKWEDLKFEVPVGRSATGLPCLKGNEEKGMKTILSGCSGEIRPGGLLAIMGSSGAGKTTLLNLLAGRVTSAKGSQSTGRVLVNGEKRDFSKFRQVASYVLQDDDLFAELTVREQVEFGAMLRLPNTMPVEKKQLAVDRVITELSLSKVANTNIGNELVRGVSGGERKRVSIGTELVTNPSMLFLDEPTSGLDAFNALNVISTLRRLAYNGRTVVTTIHQPRSNIYSMFDMLLLLSQGRVMYFGPAKDAVAYFSALSFHCPAQFNPADYFIDLVSVDSRSPDAEAVTKKRVAVLADKYSNSAPMITEYGEDSEAGSQMIANEADTQLRKRKYQNSWFTEVRYLAVRACKLMVRERTANFSRLGQTIVFSILLGLIWLNAGRSDTAADARSLVGILFFLLINQCFGGAFSIIFVFPLERSVVTRERASGTYRVSSYFFSKTICELPRTFFFNMLFSVILYWMVGLRATAGAFFFFVFAVFITTVTAESMSLAISILAADPQAAAALTPVALIIGVLFGGFFIDGAQIYDWLAWIKWTSLVQYAFVALVENEFEGRDIPGFSFAGNGFSKWENLGFLVLLLVVLRGLGYFFLLKFRAPTFDKTL